MDAEARLARYATPKASEAEHIAAQEEVTQLSTTAIIGLVLMRSAPSRRPGRRAIGQRTRAVNLYLVVNEGGLPLTAGALRDRFDKAREAAGVPNAGFQFRDLRDKAGPTR